MTAADRVRAERAAQGLPTPAAPIGDPAVDARVAAAYRTTATLLTSAKASSDRTTPHVPPAAGEAFGAAGSTRNGVRGSAPHAARAGQPSGSSAPARSTHHKQKAADADTSTASQTAAGG